MEKKTYKIGIDARFYGPLGKGLGRYTQEIVDGILSIDNSNEYVIFLSKENFDEFEIPRSRVTKVLADVRWYTAYEQFAMPRLIKEQKLDLMHFPHFNVPVFCPVPFVVTIHDLILTKFPTMRATTLGPIKYFLKNIGYRFVINQGIRRAKKVIAISQFTKDDIVKKFKVNPSKIIVTYEGVANLAKGQDSRFTAKLNQQEILSGYCILEPYLLYVGNAYPHKNLEFLISVFKKAQLQFPDLKLVLVGKKDYFYNRLAEYAQEISASSVIFPGYVPDRELEVLFSHALAYVFPSKFEGFGLPPLEAMAHGCPVISSNATCLPEVLGDAVLFADPENEIEWLDRIKQLINTESLRTSLIAKAYERVALYDWRRCAQQTKEIYEGILK